MQKSSHQKTDYDRLHKIPCGSSAKPIFMNNQVEPQIPQSTNQTKRAFICSSE